ncbi:MAG TPA: hypothetical protein PKH10_08825, partial [bacterium]|nr:hypothetical protein [bacterium]
MRNIILTVVALVGILCTGVLSAADGDERWVAMNPGSSGTNGSVLAMAQHGEYLYVGGDFTLIGNVLANYVARFHIPTGTWEPL